ncbi:hypothetical protein MTO96_022968 [Rhipicephalus appendiculatus]
MLNRVLFFAQFLCCSPMTFIDGLFPQGFIPAQATDHALHSTPPLVSARDGLCPRCPVAPACDSFGMCDYSLVIAPYASRSYVTSSAAPFSVRRWTLTWSQRA